MGKKFRGIDMLNKMPLLFSKLYIKNLEKQRLSVYDVLYNKKFRDISDFINHFSWGSSNEGSEFWNKVFDGKSKEAFQLYKNNKQ